MRQLRFLFHYDAVCLRKLSYTFLKLFVVLKINVLYFGVKILNNL